MDVTSSDDVEAVVQEAHVVINAVAIYSHFDNPVLPACVHHRRHYLDIVGELSQLRGIIHRQDLVLFRLHRQLIPSALYSAALITLLPNQTL